MSRTLLAVLILSEVVSAGLIYRLWTRKLRAGRWERGWLTVALLTPFIGWLLYGFLEPPPDRPRLKLLDEGAVAADPDRLELLWLLRDELDDALLREMAGCSGGPDQAENIEALTEILQTGEVPAPLPPEPGEVCALLRHGGVEPGRPLSPEGRRYQVMCLFACWILVQANAQPAKEQHGLSEDVEVALRCLTGSSLALGPAFARASARFVSWAQSKREMGRDPAENLYYLLSLLILRCASLDKENIAGLLAVYDTLMIEEQSLRRRMSGESPPDGQPGPAWLFGLGGDVDSQRKWVRMAAWALDRASSPAAGGLHPRLAELEHRLVDSLPKGDRPA